MGGWRKLVALDAQRVHKQKFRHPGRRPGIHGLAAALEQSSNAIRNNLKHVPGRVDSRLRGNDQG